MLAILVESTHTSCLFQKDPLNLRVGIYKHVMMLCLWGGNHITSSYTVSGMVRGKTCPSLVAPSQAVSALFSCMGPGCWGSFGLIAAGVRIGRVCSQSMRTFESLERHFVQLDLASRSARFCERVCHLANMPVRKRLKQSEALLEDC